ncbi:hypothetical protein AB2L27_16835 [Kineococcus sp. LSe6-4]|uniref:Uncharacterized protein n=1 Tax=Kineococcus halophytocola TaxID=3234027 RepID=A0ABV4H7N4_9ACTN
MVEEDAWIQAIGCVYLTPHPRGYANRLEAAFDKAALNERLKESWKATDGRPVEVFVWFHQNDIEAKSIPNPGDVSIRATKGGVRVRMTSSAAHIGGEVSAADAVKTDFLLVMEALERRFGASLTPP